MNYRCNHKMLLLLSHQSRNLHFFSFTLADETKVSLNQVIACHCDKLLWISLHVMKNNCETCPYIENVKRILYEVESSAYC